MNCWWNLDCGKQQKRRETEIGLIKDERIKRKLKTHFCSRINTLNIMCRKPNSYLKKLFLIKQNCNEQN
jgi:hypothetical protein